MSAHEDRVPDRGAEERYPFSLNGVLVGCVRPYDLHTANRAIRSRTELARAVGSTV